MSAKIKQELINPPRGTTDLLPNDFLYWDYFLSAVNKYAEIYGFGKMETPIMEDTALFVRSIGETTDIVEKEMFSFTTRGGDKLTLRPEGTASVVRAHITNGMSKWSQPVKLYYIWPMFRYERPQAGRRRQFNQAGFEILGGGDPIFDAQIIQLCWTLFKKLKLKNIVIQINSIGDAKCRSKYRSALVDYYRPRASKLCANCRVRLAKNPLRLLDCKEEKCVLIRSSAPQIVDYLCQECHDHFKLVLEYLDEINLPYMLSPYLVRGLDYYTKTVFEFISEGDEYRQSSLGGGGRYDTLVEMLGGEPTPAVGVALGIERIVEKIKEAKLNLGKKVSAKVFLVQLCDLAKKKSFKLFNDLIEAGVPAMESFGRGSIKSQLRVANRLKIKTALIIGQKEALDNTVIIRDMESGTQEVVDRAKIINIIRKKKQER